MIDHQEDTRFNVFSLHLQFIIYCKKYSVFPTNQLFLGIDY